jgi:hypothetical protein
MSTVNWVLTNGKYEVSTVNHLLCIAARGVGFTTTGSPPASQALFMSSPYIQTVDIDCAGTTMIPIGDTTIAFTGGYNGQGFQVLNWQNNQGNTNDNQGLFGRCGGCLLTNIIMGGVIKVKGGNNCAAIVASGSNSTNNVINFGTGSIISGLSNVGGGIGTLGINTQASGIKVNGTVTITGTSNVGGYCGQSGNSTLTDITVSIVGNITGTNYVGGILGLGAAMNMVACINNMTGNITGTSYIVGGIFGQINQTADGCTNAMIGNISGNYSVGGIGNMTTCQDCINIMTGNIIGTQYSDSSAGIGSASTIKRCVVAMNGNTSYLFVNDTAISANALLNITNNVWSNRFGMTVNGVTKTEDPSRVSTLASFDTYPNNLGTAGRINMWDSVGHVPYWTYGLTRTVNNGFTSQSISVSTLTSTNQYGNATLTWTAIPGYTSYRLNTNPGGEVADVTTATGISALTKATSGLISGSDYIAGLYVSNDGTTYVDTGIRVGFTTADCTVFNKNPTQTTVLSPTWTSVNTITTFRVQVKAFGSAQFVAAGPTSSLTADTTGLVANTYYSIILEGSTDGTTYVRLAYPQNHTTLPLVLWALLNGKYTVSTPLHLQAIAANGVGYASGLIVPTVYLTSGYVQINDINCSGLTMVPIGNSTTAFTGGYNGQGFQVLNWQNDQTNTNDNQGMFGRCGGCLLTNIIMGGVIKVKGGNNCAAIVASGSNSTNNVINFGTGSIISGLSNVGGGIGTLGINTQASGIKVNGTVTITGTSNVGGYCGQSGNSPLTDITVSIAGNITGTNYVGGILGLGAAMSMTACINNMTGNITGTSYIVGGIFGQINQTADGCTNAMIGNISGNYSVGGIGNMTTCQDCINIMTGNIIGTQYSDSSAGIGSASTIKRCVVAMNGNTSYLFVNDTAISANALLNITNNVWSNRFGMKVNGVTKTEDPSLVATLASFDTYPNNLGTAGRINMWDSVGHVPYWTYGTTRTVNNGFTSQAITVSALTSTNQYGNATLTWTAISGYTSYRLDTNPGGEVADVTTATGISALTKATSGLISGSDYIAGLYVSSNGTTYVDTGIRVGFATADCTVFNKNATQTTVLSPTWTSVNTITSFRVKAKKFGSAQFVAAGPTSSLTANTTGLIANTYYSIILEGSTDGITYVRLAYPQKHTTFPLVLWALLNGKYTVSTPLHLQAIAANGVGYASGLIVPTIYLTSGYVQVNDIDCIGLTMVPIGNSTTAFTGGYNGQGYQILNWQNDQTNTNDNQGMFGRCSGCLLTNIIMGGVIKVKGGNNCAAIVASGSNSTNNVINFGTGSIISGLSNVGGGIGTLGINTQASGIRVNGTVTITGTSNVGGYCGQSGNSYLTDITVSIVGNITGTNYVGGILGLGAAMNMTACINNMIGNVTATSYAVGGMFGQIGQIADSCTNYMTGNVSGTTIVGGIGGQMNSCQDCINCMKGNIVSTSNSGSSGGIGYSTASRYTRCCVCTTGNVPYILSQESSFNVGTVIVTNCVYSNRFGMTVNGATLSVSNSYFTNVPLNVFPTAALSTNGTLKYFESTLFLPYWINGTVNSNPLIPALTVTAAVTASTLPAGNGAVVLTVSGGTGIYSYTWTKNAALFAYTRDITNIQQGVYVCTILSGTSTTTVTKNVTSGFTFVASPTSISVTWQPYQALTSYRLQYKSPSDSDFTTYINNTANLNAVVYGLAPSTTYTFQVLNPLTNIVIYSGIKTTTTNTLENFTKASIVPSTGVASLSAIVPPPGITQEQIVALVFTTGDIILTTTQEVSVQTIPASIVQTATSLSIGGVPYVYIPFSSAIVTPQQVNLVDSTSTSIPIVYGTSSIKIGGVDRFIGDSFLLDGRTVTLLSV